MATNPLTAAQQALPIVSWPVHPQRTRPRRPGEGPAHVLVIHTSEQLYPTSRSAEDLARAIGSPPVTVNGHTNQASYHWAVDLDSIAALVPPDDIAYHAPPNWHGEAICFTGRAGRDWTGLTDAVDDFPELELAARLAAWRCVARGWPVRRLTVAQLQAGERGICGHVDISAAFHQTDHTDPGVGFPWAMFLALVQVGVDQITQLPEAPVYNLAIHVPNDPTRAEALVVHDGNGISIIGYSTPEDARTISAAVGAPRVPVTAAQYDDYIDHATT